MTHRRKFIRSFGTGIALTALSNRLFAWYNQPLYNDSIHSTFGLQLYSLRDDMPKDPKGVLKQVAADGYKQIEGFEGSMGMFWGMRAKEFKNYLEGLGLQFISSHCNTDKNFEEKVEQAASIGMKYLIVPYLGQQKEIDEYKKAAEKFNVKAELCHKAGLRFAYHNHDYSFVPVNGVFPQDILMQNSDKNLVDFEMDIYWVVTAGQDPVKWLEKYPGRFRLCHIKDRKKGAPLADKDASVDLGLGEINFPKIFEVAKKQGVKYYIVEQEKYENSTPLQAAKVDADYLKKLKL